MNDHTDGNLNTSLHCPWRYLDFHRYDHSLSNFRFSLRFWNHAPPKINFQSRYLVLKKCRIYDWILNIVPNLDAFFSKLNTLNCKIFSFGPNHGWPSVQFSHFAPSKRECFLRAWLMLAVYIADYLLLTDVNKKRTFIHSTRPTQDRVLSILNSSLCMTDEWNASIDRK